MVFAAFDYTVLYFHASKNVPILMKASRVARHSRVIARLSHEAFSFSSSTSSRGSLRGAR